MDEFRVCLLSAKESSNASCCRTGWQAGEDFAAAWGAGQAEDGSPELRAMSRKNARFYVSGQRVPEPALLLTGGSESLPASGWQKGEIVP